MKRTLSLVLSLIMISGIFTSIPVSVNVASVDDLTFTLNDDGQSYSVTNCNTSAIGELVIPSIYSDLPVTRIGNSAFESCTNVTSITIPASITYIGSLAFMDCGVKKVNITDLSAWCGVKFALYYPGGGCYDWSSNPLCNGGELYLNGSRLTDLVVPADVTTISDSAFYNCSFNSVTLHDDIEYIGINALGGEIANLYVSDISKLCSIDYPDYTHYGYSVTQNARLSKSGPFHAKNLYVNNVRTTELVIPAGVTRIGDYAFSGFENLTSITLPTTLQRVGYCAFKGCKNLASVTLPDGVTSIGESAFSNCTGLTSFTMPRGITEINNYAFSGCKNLGKVIWPYCEGKINNRVYIGSYGVGFEAAEHYYADCEPSDWVIDEEATCTESGSEHTECPDCRNILETNVILPTGHTKGEWIIDTEATVAASGTKHKECTTCGEILETATIPQLKPATPKVTTTNEIGGVQIKWNAVDGAIRYVVYRRQGGYNTWVNVGTTTGTTLLDKNVKSGIFYVYSVRAYNSAGQYSDFISANTQTRKYMETPKLTGISNATNGLYIKWNAVAGITDGYRVYRRGAGSTYWTYLGTVKTTYFTDTSVKVRSGEYFRYTVIADGGYHSKFDTTGLYLKRLANPTLTSAVSYKSGITVKWEAVMGTTGYNVYRKTANSGWQKIATVSGTNTTSYVDKSAVKGTTYTYTVRAVCGKYISYYNSGISCRDKY